MTEPEIHALLIKVCFAVAGIVFVVLGRMSAPYGRHNRVGFGPGLGVKLGWIVMESPSVFLFVGLFLIGPRSDQLVPRLFCVLWLAHYAHRAVVYPLMLRPSDHRTPLLIIALGFSFNVLNSYINARSLSAFGPEYTWRWLYSIRFLYGLLLFVTGFVTNRWADLVLRRLRSGNERGYKIPRGGLYEQISCPNYFGEIVMWIGWAIMTWSPAGLAFAVFTIANLVPRAYAHHQWYRRQFRDYPSSRRAIIPYVL